MQRRIERAILGGLDLERAQVAPLDAQQRLMMADLFDQQCFIHRLYRAERPLRLSGSNINER